MKTIKQTLPLLAVFFMAGCVSQQMTSQQASAGSGSGGQARPTVVVARPANTGPRIINKVVPAGQTVEVQSSIAFNPDCTSRGLNTIRVTQPPVHGKIKIVQREGYTLFPPNHPAAICNKTKLPGVFADYTPDEGFTGSDFAEVEILTNSGGDATYKISITVK